MIAVIGNYTKAIRKRSKVTGTQQIAFERVEKCVLSYPEGSFRICFISYTMHDLIKVLQIYKKLNI